jgi:heme exporter protein CcmD
MDEFTLEIIYSPEWLRLPCRAMAGREERVQALAMGGYGGYVWAAFGFTLISMVTLLWQSWRAQQRRADELAALRHTVRASRPGQGSAPAAAATGRRLVATKPATTGLSGRNGATSDAPGPHLATARPTSGT